MSRQIHTAIPQEKPVRLQEYGVGIFEGLDTKSAWKKALKKGGVRVNNTPGTSATYIYGGELIEWQPLPKKPSSKALILPLEVLYEDAHMAAIYKPAGLLVSGNSFKTLARALEQNVKPSHEKDACLPQPVHRLDSFVDFFIINEITGNIDGYRLSTYLHKDRGQKLKMGPIWDLNIGYNKQGRVPFNDWIANYNLHVSQDAWMVPFWWPRLLKDPLFKAALKSRWQTLRAGAFSNAQVLGLVHGTATYLQDNGAVDRNYQKWIGIPVDYPAAVGELSTYLENRLQWMDQTIGGF